MKQKRKRQRPSTTEQKLVVWAAVVVLIMAGCVQPAQSSQQAVAPALNADPDTSMELIAYGEDIGLAEVDGDDLARLVEGNTTFALDFYQQLREGEAGNLFFSPFSISQALAMAYAGAGGDTAEQMARVLGLELPAERLHPTFQALHDLLSSREAAPSNMPLGDQRQEELPSGLELHIANGAWAQEHYPFLPSYLELVGQYYGAGLKLVDYIHDYEQIRNIINQWVEEQTAGRIRDLLPPGSLSPISRLVLVNAIYFKASWASPFDPLKTRNRPFTLLDGGQVQVPTMHGEMHGRYATERDFQAVELPYYGDQAAMLIVLPDEGRFEAVEKGLSADGLRSIDEQLRPDKLEISLPKFRILMSKELSMFLSAMGMEDAFDASLADFSRMVDPEKGRLVIDEVYHKAFVEVDEEGTEAAAATAVVLEWISTYRPEPQVVTIDRPFLFFVRDGETGAILFMGRVLDPS